MPKIPPGALVGGLEAVERTWGGAAHLLSWDPRAAPPWTSAWFESELGAVVRPTGMRSSSGRAGVDQSDLEVIVLQRLDHRAGVEPQDLGEVGCGRATPHARRSARCSRSATRFRARSTSTSGTSSLLNCAIRSTRSRRARRCRGCRHTSRGTDGPRSTSSRSGAGRRSSPSGYPSAETSGPAERPAARRWRRSAGGRPTATAGVEEVHARRGA